MFPKRGFRSVFALTLGTLSQVAMAIGSVSAPIERAEVESVRAGIRGATLVVDWQGTGDYTTIQVALDASTNGDTIIVLPSVGAPGGAYIENVIFPARAITLRSVNPEDPAIVAATVIDGNAAGSVVTFEPGTPPEATLTGFTITNGSGTQSSGGTCGAGLHLVSSSPRIANNTITGNSAVGFFDAVGGGLYLRDSSPVIANNTIAGNSARGPYTSCGAGIYLENSSPTIENNTIAGNSTEYSERSAGAGLYLEWGGTPTIINNTIAGNNARSGNGGGLYVGSRYATVANNTITGNSAKSGGGLCLNNSAATIVNSTISNNAASPAGGGLFLDRSSPVMANTIIAFNSSGLRCYGDGSPTLRHDCVYGNTEYNYSGLTDPTGTDGNISVDPRLADPGDGNTRLTADSPCVDVGSNGFAVGDFDLDRHARILDGDGDGAAVVDMGAYEYRRGDLDSDGDVDLTDFAVLVECLQGPAVAYPVGCSGADLDVDADVDLADFAVFERG
jgi:hypothetical protein